MLLNLIKHCGWYYSRHIDWGKCLSSFQYPKVQSESEIAYEQNQPRPTKVNEILRPVLNATYNKHKEQQSGYHDRYTSLKGSEIPIECSSDINTNFKLTIGTVSIGSLSVE